MIIRLTNLLVHSHPLRMKYQVEGIQEILVNFAQAINPGVCYLC